jgi:hypothetical protein
MENNSKITELESKLSKLDKRTKEYKQLKLELDTLVSEEDDNPTETSGTKEEYIVSDETYKRVNSFKGRMTGEDVTWLFDTYNEVFNAKRKKCNCRGVIKQTLAKLQVTGRKERE